MGTRAPDARAVAVTAIMIAVVAAFTMFIRVPVPATGGYANLSDVAIFFVAFTLGPIPALVAGGVGTGLADVLGGYAAFAWLSFIAHGLQGLLAGYVARRGRGPAWTFAAWLVGAAAMVLGYFGGEALVMTGIGPALQELPVNVGQVVIGGVLGIGLAVAVRQAYPPITQWGRPRTVHYEGR